jgi:hypothetical protein
MSIEGHATAAIVSTGHRFLMSVEGHATAAIVSTDAVYQSYDNALVVLLDTAKGGLHPELCGTSESTVDTI